ncbi:GNAT family N-acetyltransferase [Terribacillus saccharophilus]|uniref:GNAT family N-acetyltransferase n=1 Tax=Terribacillus saccharophilus TaxID=361277 RepID=A0A268A8X7_9BACI|nr:GNAT family N-acetyltransferase [Terribacillus saccharophilus]PAD20578.1 GNAT family N-acetyltransferase [Terribacillus saccharophilus]PAF39126.1 GNAT family N-acetyltransferase [Terribacillus saccharophilus]
MRIVQENNEEASEYIRERLIAYNAEQLPEEAKSNKETAAFTVRDEAGGIVGGVTCTLYWKHMHIDFLWVEETKRKEGLGAKLLAEAENFAKQKGARLIKLDSFSFQAPAFYEKHGYTVFGKVEDHPVGHTQYYLVKWL